MKHILNDISQFEKQRILEQYTQNKYVDTTKFKKLIESKLGSVKPLLNEQVEPNAGSIQQFLKDNLPDPNLKVDFVFGNGTAAAAAKYIAKSWNTKGYDNITTVQQLWQVMKNYKNDVGETPGFGPKMATELARVLNQGKTKLDQAAAKPAAAPAAKPVVQSKPIVYGLLTVDLGKRTLTLNSKIDFERRGGGSELRLGKGVTFTKKPNGTLVTSNQYAQLVSDLVGQVEEELKGVTITYYCKTENLDIAGRSILFYNEDFKMVSKKGFDTLCALK
jgi:hypothetical protein